MKAQHQHLGLLMVHTHAHVQNPTPIMHRHWRSFCCHVWFRPDWDATVSWLRGMGADLVTTEQDIKADLGKATVAGSN